MAGEQVGENENRLGQIGSCSFSHHLRCCSSSTTNLSTYKYCLIFVEKQEEEGRKTRSSIGNNFPSRNRLPWK